MPDSQDLNGAAVEVTDKPRGLFSLAVCDVRNVLLPFGVEYNRFIGSYGAAHRKFIHREASKDI